MRRILLVMTLLLIYSQINFSQLNNIGNFNRAGLTQDTLMPYINTSGGPANNGIRSVWVAEVDMDNDGKPEILVTDYSNNGRVHVLELNGNVLEVVWSSPKIQGHTGSGSTPRWVRNGDLDGDGKQEIIFPVSNGSLDFAVYVYEWTGNDNEYQEAAILDANALNSLGLGNFRTNRELGTVYDFDGDGSSELIMTNRDNRMYVIGISGDIPGFGSWVVEGGSPANVPKIGAGSHWHSIPADLNGDGSIEIINHYWNFGGFFTAKPNGVDSYTYPDTSQANHYIEFFRTANADVVAFMGIQKADVDGDGSDEIAFIQYVNGQHADDYDLFLINFENSDNPMYSWTQDKIGKIAENAWEAAGLSGGSFWGIGAADLNGNGREEILMGGSNGYNIVAVEYNGTGSLLDKNNYTVSVVYTDDYTVRNSRYAIRDSSGVIDTVATGEAPFVSKMYSGSDINNNGKLEVLLSYQSVFDSITYVYQTWNGTVFVDDSTVKVFNPDQVTIRVIESSVTGVEVFDYSVITPEHYVLEQNYPNPFNPNTTIRFFLPIDKKISLTIYDVLGNEVKTLIDNSDYSAGTYQVNWDGKNNFGKQVASGQYIYTLKYGNFTKSMKMTFLK